MATKSEHERITILESKIAEIGKGLAAKLDDIGRMTPGSDIDDGFGPVNPELFSTRRIAPSLIQNYYLGEPVAAGPQFITRTGEVLTHCQVYRAWRNQTGAAQNRTISVYPSNGQFPPRATVTVFVAPDGHTGAPRANMNPTSVGQNGDRVAKNVPNGQAVFVHLSSRRGANVTADISDNP